MSKTTPGSLLALLLWCAPAGSAQTHPASGPEAVWRGQVQVGNEPPSRWEVQLPTAPSPDSGRVEIDGQTHGRLIQLIRRADSIAFAVVIASDTLRLAGHIAKGEVNGRVVRSRDQAVGAFSLVRTVGVDSVSLPMITGAYQLGPGWLVAISGISGGQFGPALTDYATGVSRVLWTTSESTLVAGPALLVAAPVEIRVTLRRVAGEQPRLRFDGLGARPIEVARFQFRQVDFLVQTDSLKLAGTITYPPGKGPHPAIIGLHGSGPGVRNTALAYWYPYHGIAFVGFDKRGSGQSTGSLTLAGIEDLAADGLAVLREVHRQPDIDSRQIGVYGQSEGGWVAPVVAAKARSAGLPDLSFVMVTPGSGLAIHEHILYEVRMTALGNGLSEVEAERAVSLRRLLNAAVLADTGWEKLRAEIRAHRGEPWFRSARVSLEWLDPDDHAFNRRLRRVLAFDPAPYWSEVTSPVLALYGEYDTHTPPRPSVDRIAGALHRGGNGDVTFGIFPAGNHAFFEGKTGFDREFPWAERYVPGFFAAELDWLARRVRVANTKPQ